MVGDLLVTEENGVLGDHCGRSRVSYYPGGACNQDAVDAVQSIGAAMEVGVRISGHVHESTKCSSELRLVLSRMSTFDSS